MQILEGHTGVVFALAFSPDGALLASMGKDDTIRLWQLPGGSPLATLPGSRFAVPHLVFSPDGRWLAAPGKGRDSAAWVWDRQSGSHLELKLGSHPRGTPALRLPCALGFTPDGRHLVVCGWAGSRGIAWTRQRVKGLYRRWEVGTWNELPAADSDLENRTLRQPWALCPTAGLLARPDYDGVSFWDLQAGKERVRIQGTGTAALGALTFSPNGGRLAIARARVITTIDVPGQKVLAVWKNPTPKYVQSLAFSPDVGTLISVSNDSLARLWDTESGRELASYSWGLEELKAAAIAPDGMRAAVSGRKGAILLWDLD